MVLHNEQVIFTLTHKKRIFEFVTVLMVYLRTERSLTKTYAKYDYCSY